MNAEETMSTQGRGIAFSTDEAAINQLTASYERFREIHEEKEEQQRLAGQRIQEETRHRARIGR